MNNKFLRISLKIFYALLLLLTLGSLIKTNAQSNDKYLFHDSHFHITNFIQEGIDINFYVDEIMGDKVGRSTLFGIPLQQQWSYRVTGENAPTYYLDTDAPLY
ncbi:MAG: amidohydrolase, partial [Ignavibacteriales bacterium]